MELRINGQTHAIAEPWLDERLLWVLREHLGLVGAKYGCGSGQCGACTVLVDGVPQRSCVLPLAAVAGRQLTTIEGLAPPGDLHPLQQAWLEERVPQCGYCQSGQLLCAVALLRAVPKPADEEIDRALAGHLCRCGTQDRVRRAIRRVAGDTA